MSEPPSTDPPRPPRADLDPESAVIDALFTAAERRLIRSEFRARGGQTYPLDEGIWLHRWAAGPHQGQPKLEPDRDPHAAGTRLDRGRRSAGSPPLRAVHPGRSGRIAAHGTGPAVVAARPVRSLARGAGRQTGTRIDRAAGADRGCTPESFPRWLLSRNPAAPRNPLFRLAALPGRTEVIHRNC